ncbi:HemK family methyltransferase [Spizellomyces punctatus DAOM BR117]|uniref:peptide chain release factor N(5)-glutamine methyltransferase n=1 Tax=Spizellomyces punctatus (strain DAOM BR117) TaxID=645134 RepID=A0A0L0HLF2_SPIPD|nr:HemK family methyltransferase [Spizellomyces punctatus DAOM BR117]KND01725.1 HemK family methyltransferase [Spizellomyces punctatus DAOM BR117]|eukprot:XP_016609764.1 HemK family methyltransferase [Spizellomyces punctatus DAOM BR117]
MAVSGLQPGRALYNSLVTRLLPACDNDSQAAARELKWMVEKLHSRRSRSAYYFPRPSRPSPIPTFAPTILERSLSELCTVEEQRRLDQWIYERVEKKRPLQYLLGTQPFCGLELKVRRPTLIPRWETEEWTMKLIDALKPHIATRSSHEKEPFRILDLCTGTGCIAISLAHHLSGIGDVHVTAADISASALRLTRVNARRLDISPSLLDVQWVDVWDDGVVQHLGGHVSRRFDMIVSNPPYVSKQEFLELDEDVKEWEDHCALIADNNGTAFHERIAFVAQRWLLKPASETDSRVPIPRLVTEIGSEQASRVTQIMQNSGFSQICVWRDLAKAARCVVGY